MVKAGREKWMSKIIDMLYSVQTEQEEKFCIRAAVFIR